MTDLGGSTTSPVAGGSSGQPPAGGVAAPTAASPNGGVGLLGWMRAGTLPLHPHLDDVTGGVIDYLRTQWGTDHLAAADPHPVYLTALEGNTAYAPLDPGGGGYLTQTAGDTRYVNTAGDTLTGTLNGIEVLLTNQINAPHHFAIAPAGTLRDFRWYTDTLPRWLLAANEAAESGSNAGSDLELYRYDDAGTPLGTALSITRATGAATLAGPLHLGAADTTLQRAGAGALRVDTHLGVAAAPAAWAAGFAALQVGQQFALMGAAGLATAKLMANSYYDGAFRALAAGPAVRFEFESGALAVGTAPSVAAGAAQTFTTRAHVAPAGTLTLSPDAGQNALVANGPIVANDTIASAGGTALSSTGHFGIALPGAGYVIYPTLTDAFALGSSTNRWSDLHAQSATLGALAVTGNLGLFGTAATTKKTVTGSRGANAALASLLTHLAAYGLITDSTTA